MLCLARSCVSAPSDAPVVAAFGGCFGVFSYVPMFGFESGQRAAVLVSLFYLSSLYYYYYSSFCVLIQILSVVSRDDCFVLVVL